MAGLCWVVVVLAVFLSAENCFAAVDQTKLAGIVDAILKEYETSGMFSLAVSIPDNQNQNTDQNLQQVFTSDPGNDVKTTINRGEVYKGSRVIAATVLKQSNGIDRAESRVVDYFNDLFQKQNPNDNDMLLFYVSSSPCVEKCSSETNGDNILQRINQTRQWQSYAVVFSKILQPPNGQPNTPQQRRTALEQLGTSVGLDNIFRCDRGSSRMACTSCSNGSQVADYCVSGDMGTRGSRATGGGMSRGGGRARGWSWFRGLGGVKRGSMSRGGGMGKGWGRGRGREGRRSRGWGLGKGRDRGRGGRRSKGWGLGKGWGRGRGGRRSRGWGLGKGWGRGRGGRRSRGWGWGKGRDRGRGGRRSKGWGLGKGWGRGRGGRRSRG